MEILSRNLAIAEDLGKKATSDRLSPVNGDNSATTGYVTQEVMTPLDADNFKPESAKRRDPLRAT